MNFETIKYRVENEIADIMLYRPEVLNAINSKMDLELAEALKLAGEDENIKVIIIRGYGKAFSAGQDVRDFEIAYQKGETPDVRKGLLRRKRVFQLIREIPKPVIAGINGVAAGVAISLILVCDIRVASKKARFVPAFARIGLVPDGGFIYLLSQYLPFNRIFDIYAMNKEISVDEAYRFGIVDYLVEDDKFEEELFQIAKNYAKGPIKAFAYTKEIINQVLMSIFNNAYNLEMEMQEKAMSTYDHKEGIKAFKEKREPQFRGK